MASGLRTLPSGGKSRLDAGRCRGTPMSETEIWEPIASAPFDRDLELAVVDRHRVHPLVFACRRTAGGWIKGSSRERLVVSPTHWRLWSGETT